ncbi:hypothetical protein ACLOJK_040394, partial [Asimina triloba]
MRAVDDVGRKHAETEASVAGGSGRMWASSCSSRSSGGRGGGGGCSSDVVAKMSLKGPVDLFAGTEICRMPTGLDRFLQQGPVDHS